MHYYVFKVTEINSTEIQCKFINKFELLKEAQALSRSSRAELPLNGTIHINMLHAENQAHAEELLSEKYSQNITMSWDGEQQ